MATQEVSLQPGETKVITFEAIPHEAKTYQVSVNGLTGIFIAKEVPISAEIRDAYIYDRHAKTTIYWNGYANLDQPWLEEEPQAVDWTQVASRDTIIGFVLQNNSSIPVAFDFRLWQYQWTMVDNKQKYVTIDLIPTSAAPIPMENGEYQADKVLMPGDTLGPGQRGFMAAPATIGRRWCTFNCTATYNGKSASGMVKGWGGY